MEKILQPIAQIEPTSKEPWLESTVGLKVVLEHKYDWWTPFEEWEHPYTNELRVFLLDEEGEETSGDGICSRDARKLQSFLDKWILRLLRDKGTLLEEFDVVQELMKLGVTRF